MSRPSAPSAIKSSVTGFLCLRQNLIIGSINSLHAALSSSISRKGFMTILSYFFNSRSSFKISRSFGTVNE